VCPFRNCSGGLPPATPRPLPGVEYDRRQLKAPAPTTLAERRYNKLTHHQKRSGGGGIITLE
jgi:hypothetical protein